MENASKALLIAGAILLVIAIIAIAVGIVSSTRGTIDSAENQIDSMAVQMHNNQFLQYEGIGKSMEEARELLAVIAKNNENTKSNEFIVNIGKLYYCKESNPSNVYVTDNIYSFGSLTINELYSNSYFTGGTLSTNKGKTYNIQFEYNNNGIINVVNFCRQYR